LTGAKLKGTYLTISNLSGVDMRKATSISETIFYEAIMGRKMIPDGKNNLNFNKINTKIYLI
jgi:hypothetical protein